jgi:ubiquinone/menaquinone biosynthesis C-methylase UbiE
MAVTAVDTYCKSMKRSNVVRSDPYVARWQNKTYAESYLRFTERDGPNAREWVSRLHLTGTSVVVDLGCGEGKVLVAVAPHIQRGIGIDGSPHMLAAARWYAQQRGVTNVEFLERDFRMLMLEPGLADAVISQYALHHITDAEKATLLAGIYQLLQPAGLFYLEDDTFNFAPAELEQRVPEIHAQWEQEFGPARGQYFRETLVGEDFEHTSYWTDLRAMLTEAGLVIVQHQSHGPSGVSLLMRRG